MSIKLNLDHVMRETLPLIRRAVGECAFR